MSCIQSAVVESVLKARLLNCRRIFLAISSRKKHSDGVGRTTARQLKSKRYSETLNLPKTTFPLSVRDGLGPQREIEIQKTCGFSELYQWQASQEREKTFVLHDGPPYANGKTHVGHAVNKILKDITIRYKLLRGYRIHYVPGWDCHGMPIEVKALKQTRQTLQEFTPLQIRDRARKFALETIEEQQQSFKRWGVMADWASYYTTLSPEYQTTQLDIFWRMYEKGLIYRGYMPVFWSPSSRTALAEAELEYKSDHQSTAVYAKFPMRHLPSSLSHWTGSGDHVSAVIWTTTPWTLPFNQAICFSTLLRYSLLRDQESQEVYLCEESFAVTLSAILGKQLLLLATLEGKSLDGATYVHPLTGTELPFLPGAHVLQGKGTGLVHTAPAHGHDDFQVALGHDLPVTCNVDKSGRYKEGVGCGLEGKVVGQDADEAVISLLGEKVLKVEPYIHSYPYDWRTKKPVIIRSSKQWFVDTQQLKTLALKCLGDVKIIPPQSEHGMLQQLRRRPYWCISRQRVWGLPIPVFYHRDTKEPLITRETVDGICRVIRQHGADVWWTVSVPELLSADLLSTLGKGSPADYVKGQDILDIWFDSGVSWASVLKDVGQQADVYLEGMDQFGCWFQTSLLTSVAIHGRAPYRALFVHGFTTDESGKKMSKSLGNVVDPDVVIDGGKDKNVEPAYGAEVLRWWVAHSHAHTNIMIGPSILAQFSEALFKVRKCLRYLLGSLYDFDPSCHAVPYELLLPQDRLMLHLLWEFVEQAETFYEEYSYNKVLQVLERFINTFVSSFYIHVTRDRSYCGAKNSLERRSCQTTQNHLLRTLMVVGAPILPHLMEEVHQHLPPTGATDRLFHGAWVQTDPCWHDMVLHRQFMPIFAMRDRLLDALGTENPLEYDVAICATRLLQLILRDLQKEVTSSVSQLCEIFQTSHTSLMDHPPPAIPEDSLIVHGTTDVFLPEDDKSNLFQAKREEYKLIIMPAMKHICERCRHYTALSSSSPCERCLEVLGEAWEN